MSESRLKISSERKAVNTKKTSRFSSWRKALDYIAKSLADVNSPDYRAF